MDKKKVKKYLKLIITLGIAGVAIYLVILHPYLSFKKDEKAMEEAAKRYYDLNEDKLPTGNRVATLTLQDLYQGAYLKEDIYLPYSKEPCSLEKSWVKTTYTGSEYKHYTYLECGVLKSTVDHTGPKIVLNGNDEMTIYKGDEYKELGVKRVSDKTNGEINISEVTIAGSVDTNKIGEYKVTYTAFDTFDNKTVKTRTIKVIETLGHVADKIASNGVVKGDVDDNYVVLSGIEFKIVDKDKDKVRLVTARDLANVNYDGIDDWLDYFYNSLTDEAKNMIIKNKYCSDSVGKDKADGVTSCGDTTKKRNAYVLSASDMNNSKDKDGISSLYPTTISWLANSVDKDNAMTTRDAFDGIDSKYMKFDKKYNFGVRPVITVSADLNIKSGDGKFESPYSFEETKEGEVGDAINTRHIGEYINYSGYTFRIIDVAIDGTTKVILNNAILDRIGYTNEDDIKIYNPKQKDNIGYKINKLSSEAIDNSVFVTKEVKVPIYKNEAMYKKEVSSKKYKVKFAAPDMYEIFSASSSDFDYSYWLINSSKTQRRKYIVSDIGVVYYDYLSDLETANIKVVGYLNKNVKILSGKGTYSKPYKIVK